MNSALPSASPLRILVAPNPFKGTLSASQAALEIRRGLQTWYPRAQWDLMPLADGGPGTLEALHRALGGRIQKARVADPWGRPVLAAWLEVGTWAILESSQAIGISLRRGPGDDPLRASSRGLGQLMGLAMDRGCRRMWIGLGGSATTDAGVGMMTVLAGAKLRRRIRIEVLCDVRNPLCGSRGSARTFSPQKGASPAQVKRLEFRLRMASKLMPVGLPQREGAGAAGGLGAALMAWCGGHLIPGAATVLEAASFESRMRSADLVVSGEGRFDQSSLEGKLPHEIALRARAGGKDVLLICGSLEKGLRLKGVRMLRLASLTRRRPQTHLN